MNQWRASKLNLYMECVAAAVISPVEVSLALEMERDQDGHERRTKGIGVHGYLELVPKLIRQGLNVDEAIERALREVDDEYRALCASIDDVENVPAFAADSWVEEKQFAYSFLTNEVFERPPEGPYEIGGRVDVFGLTETSVCLADYKTGDRFLTLSWQLRMYALILARRYGKNRVEAQFLKITDEGRAIPIRFVLDEQALNEIEHQVCNQFARALEVQNRPVDQLPYRENELCRWCPAFSKCTAKVKLLTAGIGLELAPGVEIPKERIGEAVMRKRAYDEASEVFEARLREWVEANGPIPLPNGKELRIQEIQKSYLDGAKAAPLLLERFGAEALELIAPRKASTTALDEYVGTLHERQTGKARGKGAKQEETRKWLEDAGALTYRPEKQLKQLKPEAKKLETKNADERIDFPTIT